MRVGLSKFVATRVPLAAAAAVVTSMMVLPSASADPGDATTIPEAKDAVSQAYRQAEQATERYHKITDELAGTESEIKALRGDVASQQKKYTALREDVSETVAGQLTGSPMGPTSKLLTTRSPEEFLDGLSALQSYSSNSEDRLATFERAAKELKVRKDQLGSKLAIVENAKQRMAKEKKLRDEKVAEAKSVLARLTAEQRARMRRQEERQREAAAQEAAAQTGGGSGDSSSGGSSGAGSSDSGGGSAPSVDASGRAKQAIDFAMAQLGEPYVYGASGPSSWDCSGLTSAAWGSAGVSLPRSSSSQAGVGQSVSTSSMSPGDLVFYYSPISHVGIYIGHGQLVHAPHPGSSVEVVSVNSMPISAVRRVG